MKAREQDLPSGPGTKIAKFIWSHAETANCVSKAAKSEAPRRPLDAGSLFASFPGSSHGWTAHGSKTTEVDQIN